MISELFAAVMVINAYERAAEGACFAEGHQHGAVYNARRRHEYPHVQQ